MLSHQLQQIQQLAAAHPGLVQQVQQVPNVNMSQVQHASAHAGAGESDDSSVDEYDMEDGMQSKGSKPWVPSIDDPNYFEELTPEEIYDSFFTIRRMGFIANRIIRKLNETKHIVSSKILEKRKKLKAVQRKQFEQLSPAGVEYLKVLLKMEIAALKNTAQNVEAGLNPSPSIKCRLAHLAEDPASADILSKIYATDSSVRTLELWKLLAIEYVNNPAWQPKRSCVDERIHDIDPSRPPEEKFTPESLRSVFSRLRIDYTKTILRFQSARQQHPQTPTAQPRDVQDTEFWERFAKHDKSMYYIYQIFFERVPPADCLMLDTALSRTEIDVDLSPSLVYSGQMTNQQVVQHQQQQQRKREREAALAAAAAAAAAADDEDNAHHVANHLTQLSGMDSLLEVDSSGHPKRVRSDDPQQQQQQQQQHMYAMGPNGAANVVQGMSPPNNPPLSSDELIWQAQVRKDRAIANYYRRLGVNNEIRFQMDMIARENVGEAMKRNLKAKMNILLLKKVEDRYDDL